MLTRMIVLALGIQFASPFTVVAPSFAAEPARKIASEQTIAEHDLDGFQMKLDAAFDKASKVLEFKDEKGGKYFPDRGFAGNSITATMIKGEGSITVDRVADPTGKSLTFYIKGSRGKLTANETIKFTASNDDAVVANQVGEMNRAIARMQSKLSEKKTGALDLVVPSAHAMFDIFGDLIRTVIVVAVGGFYLVAAVSFISQAKGVGAKVMTGVGFAVLGAYLAAVLISWNLIPFHEREYK